VTRANRISPNSEAFSLRLRNDLEIYPQRCRARKVWVIKDPVSLRYFQFREEEFEILRRLDGRWSLPEIKADFEQRFAPRRMTVARLHTFAVNLHRNGLVVSDAPGQGEPLLRRHDRNRRSAWISSLSNPLAIRFRGLDPQLLLDWLYPRMRWCFSPWFGAACVLLVLTALTLVCGQFEQFRSRLPELNALISGRNLVWLAVALGLTKLLHEFGHALTCKHYGGRCHEMGVMLLVFTPCLYCNVTDAWKLSSRWQRVAITAAGIYVEVILAAICTLLWWFSQPGFFNTVCLNVMVVCSIGTVLLNGNPLLRYDGYYLLSDVLEVPNLWQESRAGVQRWLSRFFWGIDPGNAVSAGRRSGLLLLYAGCSMVYRSIVVVSILYLVYRVLTPLGLRSLAQVVTALVIVGIVSVPVKAVWRIISNPIMRRQVKPSRVAVSAASLAVAAAFVFFVPLPCRIQSPATIEPDQARRVYVSVPGRLVQAASLGDVVKQGDVIGRLESPEVEKELESVHGQWLRQQIRVRSLESLRGQRAELASQLPAAKEILADFEQRLVQLRRDREKLSLIAPVDGVVLPPPSVLPPGESTTQLGSWVGSPLDEHNLGCALERRTLFCLIGGPDQFEAVLYIDQSDIRFVRVGQSVRLQLEIAQGKVFRGTISEVSRRNVQSLPRELAIDQELANRPDAMSIARPEETLYQAHVRLESTDVPLLIGVRGRAKIEVDWQPLGLRIYRFLTRTFKPIT
jgi:putative peptide zinc metalloprotease protein